MADKLWKAFQIFTAFLIVFLAGIGTGYSWRMAHEIESQVIKYTYIMPRSEG